MATRIEVRVVFSGRGPRTIPPACRGSIIVLLKLFETAANGTCRKLIENQGVIPSERVMALHKEH